MSTALYCLGLTRPYGTHAAPSVPPVRAALATAAMYLLLALLAAWVPLRWQAACLAGDFRRLVQRRKAAPVPVPPVPGTGRGYPAVRDTWIAPIYAKLTREGEAALRERLAAVQQATVYERRDGEIVIDQRHGIQILPRLQTPDHPPWTTGEMPVLRTPTAPQQALSEAS